MKHLIIKVLISFLLSLGVYSKVWATENLFYVLRSNSPAHITQTQNSFSSLTNHHKSIHILASQAYQVDEHGTVWGFVDPEVLDFANKKGIKVVVLVTNVKFDKNRAHQFLSNPNAQKKAIASIVDACQQHHYYGVQLDFEMIALNDRDNLTQFYTAAAEALHKKNFNVSFAVAPMLKDAPHTSEFQKRAYEIWEGAYDLQALGKSGDFISIMAYNQHCSGTTPGPTASIRWMEEVIKYALNYVPAAKISLGIPSYSNYWFTGTDSNNPTAKLSMRETGISYDKAQYLLHKYHSQWQWDDKDKINYAIYEHDWLNEYLFVEDARSFTEKLALAKKYHLRGISVFDLGTEDPAVWDVLNNSLLPRVGEDGR